ncbi:MAG TPA: hypothetical protein DER01_06890, partial [Phycisphaerales bacterium]|nr:hypothetical protein [Phycisphaerales bacterium]
MSTPQKRRILAVDTQPDWLDQHTYQVPGVGEDVMAMIQSGQFDTIMASCSAFTAIERNLVTDQANLVLNT